MIRLKLVFTFALLLISILSYSQREIEEVIVGDWIVVGLWGDTSVFHFEKDKSMYIVYRGGTIGKGELEKDGKKVKMLMRYEIQKKKNPVEINFYFFADNVYNPIRRIEGIVEILDENTLWLAMDTDKPGGYRPKDFKNMKEARVIFRTKVENVVEGCEKMTNGKFKYEDLVIGSILIERKGDSQIQTLENGERTKFKVEWLDRCSYNLTPLETYINDQTITDTTEVIMNVKIVKVKEKSYIYTTSYNKSYFRPSGELFKIRDWK